VKTMKSGGVGACMRVPAKRLGDEVGF